MELVAFSLVFNDECLSENNQAVCPSYVVLITTISNYLSLKNIVQKLITTILQERSLQSTNPTDMFHISAITTLFSAFI